jgi:hypothetical protein
MKAFESSRHALSSAGFRCPWSHARTGVQSLRAPEQLEFLRSFLLEGVNKVWEKENRSSGEGTPASQKRLGAGPLRRYRVLVIKDKL